MSDVPEEILHEILSRLPVAPLLRSRCVSKSWKSLIDSPQFIKAHLHHSRKSNCNLNIILRSRHIYSADFDLLCETNRAIFKELTHPPLETRNGGAEILGSCDGMLVLTNDEDDDTVLWNPSVRRFHEVPYNRIEFPEYFFGVKNIVYGFGYDIASDDYKFVRMVQFYKDYNGYIETEVKVYSLKSNSWRRVTDFPYCLEYKWVHGQFTNGALHWIVSRKVKSDSGSLVAAFDLGTEEYRLVPLPQFAHYDDLYINVLGGCLSLICYVSEGHVDIWVMKEYGVQESWSILFTFDFPHFNLMTLIGYSKCVKKVLLGLDGKILMWYDLDEKSTKLPMVQMPIENINKLRTCLQTLVLFNRGTCDFDLFTKKKQERKGKRRSLTRNDYLAKNRARLFPVFGHPNGHL